MSHNLLRAGAILAVALATLVSRGAAQSSAGGEVELTEREASGIAAPAFAAAREGDGEMSVSWTTTDESHVERFVVEVAAESTGEGEGGFTEMAWMPAAGAGDYNVHLTGLAPGRLHVRLRTINSSGADQLSSELSLDAEAEPQAQLRQTVQPISTPAEATAAIRP